MGATPWTSPDGTNPAARATSLTRRVATPCVKPATVPIACLQRRPRPSRPGAPPLPLRTPGPPHPLLPRKALPGPCPTLEHTSPHPSLTHRRTHAPSAAAASASLLRCPNLDFPLELPLPLSVHMLPRAPGWAPTSSWLSESLKQDLLTLRKEAVFVPDFGAGIDLPLLGRAHLSVRTPHRENTTQRGKWLRDGLGQICELIT